VFVTGDSSFGATDRLRGVVLGAYLAAATGRQLHVDPGILGRLPEDDGVGSLAWLLQEQARVAACSGCLPWANSAESAQLSFDDLQTCAAAGCLHQAQQSTSAVIQIDSNCYFLPVESSAMLHIADRHRPSSEVLLVCVDQFRSAQLHIEMQGRQSLCNATEQLRRAHKRCRQNRGGLTAGAIEANINVHGNAEASACRRLPNTHRCAASLLHAAWAGRRLPVYAAVQSANRLQRAWQRQFAPRGLAVMHVRTASLQLSSDTCAVGAVPWGDPPPQLWGANASVSSLLHHLHMGRQFLAENVSWSMSVAVLSDSARAAQWVAAALPPGVTAIASGSQPVHAAKGLSNQNGSSITAAVRSTRKLLVDLATFGRADLLLHTAGMLWSLGMHWLSWQQSPVVLPAWHPVYVRGAVRVLLTALRARAS